MTSRTTKEEVLLRVGEMQTCWLGLRQKSMKIESLWSMVDNMPEFTYAETSDHLHMLVDWLLVTGGSESLPVKVWEVPIYMWADVCWGLMKAVEVYLDRSEFRNAALQPLRKELQKFYKFYITSEQAITKENEVSDHGNRDDEESVLDSEVPF